MVGARWTVDGRCEQTDAGRCEADCRWSVRGGLSGIGASRLTLVGARELMLVGASELTLVGAMRTVDGRCEGLTLVGASELTLVGARD
jgi:hypothetical protein